MIAQKIDFTPLFHALQFGAGARRFLISIQNNSSIGFHSAEAWGRFSDGKAWAEWILENVLRATGSGKGGNGNA